MTLLLTFFILLYSFSTIDALKFESIASALQSVLLGESQPIIFPNDIQPGDVPTTDTISIPQLDNTVTADDIDDADNELVMLYELVDAYILEEGLEVEISVTTDLRGIIIDINERVLFDSGKAILKDSSKEVLGKVYELIIQFDNELVIEGHTDNNPINTKEFPSNWELSVIRAVNVLRYFTEEKDINPIRIFAAGYGEFRPIDSNDTTIGKSYNRRVNILILVDSSKEEINID